MRSMDMRWLIPLSATLVAGCVVDTPPPAGPAEVRIVTYNTHYFGDHDPAHPDGDMAGPVLADVAKLNGDLGADVWMFQEVYRSPSPNPNPYPTDHTARIAEKLPGYDSAFFPYLLAAGGTMDKGVALVWNAKKFDPIGAPMGLVFKEAGLDSTKGALGRILRRKSDAKEFLVVSLHLAASGLSGPRTKQVMEAVKHYALEVEKQAPLLSLPPAELPWVFGGDFNLVWRTAEGAYRYLVHDAGMLSGMSTAPMTHQSGLHLDHVFVRGLAVLAGQVRREATHSDHYPVLFRCDLP